MQFRSNARIRSSEDFLTCQKKGKRFSSVHTVLVHFEKPKPGCRLGVVVSKKTGNAVVRNRWKRIIREIFRHRLSQLSPNADLVVIVRNTIRGKPTLEARQELQTLFSRVQKS